MAILSVDSERKLIKQASPDKITGAWKDVSDAIVESCKNNLGNRLVSVYIGGSVGAGSARIGVSDIDSYIVTTLDADEVKIAEDSWVKEARANIHSQFPFLRGVEMHLSTTTLSEMRKFQLRMLSALVYGSDFVSEIPPYTLDRRTLARVSVSVPKDIQKARDALNDPDEDVSKVAAWIAKRLIRSAGMLVMWKGTVFTMDINPLAGMFSEQYPDQKEAMNQLMEFTKSPPTRKEVVFEMLNSFGEWLIKEDKRVFESDLSKLL